MFVKITKVESTEYSVDITLENGVSFSVCPNSEYIHVSFCRVELPMRVGAFHYQPESGSVQLGNVFDISYTKWKES